MSIVVDDMRMMCNNILTSRAAKPNAPNGAESEVKKMDKEQLVKLLVMALKDGALDDVLSEVESDVEFDDASSFEDACLMSREAGLVVSLSDGSEFQLSVVQSRRGD